MFMIERSPLIEKSTTLNRESIYNGVKKLCRRIELSGDLFEGTQVIQLKMDSGEEVNVDLALSILCGIEPFVKISISQQGQLIATRILAFGRDELDEKSETLVTGRVDVSRHSGAGIGSGLLECSELVVKKTIELNPSLQNTDTRIRIHDATNNSLHPKKGWSGTWAKNLGYIEDENNKDYYFKILKKG